MRDQSMQNPANGVWKRFLLLIPLILVVGVACHFYIASVSSTYTAYTADFFTEEEIDNIEVTMSDPDVVEVVAIERQKGANAKVTFNAVADGTTEASCGIPGKQIVWPIQGRDGAISQGHNFEGWQVLCIALDILLATLIALFASVLARLARHAWFGYEMIACGGAMLFCASQLVFFIVLPLFGYILTFSDFIYMARSTGVAFVVITFIPIAILALAVSISNISLIRHEGKRPVNLLGVAFGLVWAGANIAWYVSGGFLFDAFGYFASGIIDVLITTLIAFGECLLLSTILCAWQASRHKPRHAADFLVILGCGIRRDGTPSPLLAGRVDRALAFDEECVAGGASPATFVPSGGQGPDEVMAEAESMRAYLESKGIAPERIVLEDRSTSTQENMVYSREVIEKHTGRDIGESAVAFSTTNYHVLRSYVCAHKAGIAIEGMGSKTKAYFWPNAFLREFVGLLADQWKNILQTYLVISLAYILLQSAYMFL